MWTLILNPLCQIQDAGIVWLGWWVYAWRSLHSMHQANKLPWIFIACKKQHTDAPSLKMTKTSSTNPLSIKGKRKQPPIYFVIGSLFDVVELLPLLCVFGDFYVFLFSGKPGIPMPQTCMQQCMRVGTQACKLAKAVSGIFFCLIVSLFFDDEAEYKVTEKSSAVSVVLCYYSVLCNAYACVMNCSSKSMALQCVLNSFLTFSMFNWSIKSLSL